MAHLSSPGSNSPLIPLSPDPFGRYPSSGGEGSRQSAAYWDPPNGHVSPETLQRNSSTTSSNYQSSRKSSSRFSADSLTGEDVQSTKQANRTTLVSVKSLKKLWRKSSKASVSGPQAILPPPPPTPTLPPSMPPSGRSSPQPPPPRPDRSPHEHHDLSAALNLPITPTFGTFPPKGPSPPPVPRSDHSAQGLAPPHQLTMHLASRSPNPTPIVASKMQRSWGATGLDSLHFDQESPYPTRAAPSPRHTSRPPSTASLSEAPLGEKEKSTVRKSILKWKSSISPTPDSPADESHRRSSVSQPVRTRRPSLLSFVPGKGSGSSTPDIPPSPQIPDHFLSHRPNAESIDNRRSKMTGSTASSSAPYSPPRSQPPSLGPPGPSSPRRSIASSRGSDETRLSSSFDTSHFEMVSPVLTNKALSYPYHALDHD